MLCLDMMCVTKTVAVAQSGCLCRPCVQTGVNNGHLIEDERECIRGVAESRVLWLEDWSSPSFVGATCGPAA
jgi:hypothetical protein